MTIYVLQTVYCNCLIIIILLICHLPFFGVAKMWSYITVAITAIFFLLVILE